MTIVHLPRVDSTQGTIFDLAAQGAADRTVVVADYQAAGRGRRGRAWDAPAGTGLLTSVLLRPRSAREHWGGYSLVSALAVTDALARVAGLGSRLKWPNDVLVGGRKIAGILLESAVGQTGRVEHVVAGIGVNVGFAPQLPDMRYRGAALGGSVEAAMEKLTAALARQLARWRREGFTAVRAAWLAKAGPLGAKVDVRLGEELVRGRFAGLDPDGALLLDTAAGPRRIVSGELLGRAA